MIIENYFQTKNRKMNRNEMILAIHYISEGKTIRDTQIPITEKNVVQWQELSQEMTSGYTIDLPNNNKRA